MLGNFVSSPLADFDVRVEQTDPFGLLRMFVFRLLSESRGGEFDLLLFVEHLSSIKF